MICDIYFAFLSSAIRFLISLSNVDISASLWTLPCRVEALWRWKKSSERINSETFFHIEPRCMSYEWNFLLLLEHQQTFSKFDSKVNEKASIYWCKRNPRLRLAIQILPPKRGSKTFIIDWGIVLRLKAFCLEILWEWKEESATAWASVEMKWNFELTIIIRKQWRSRRSLDINATLYDKKSFNLRRSYFHFKADNQRHKFRL